MSTWRIPLSSPDITDRERAAVMEVLSGTALSLGPKLPEFEHAVAAFTNSPYAVAVNSGTSGLHLAIKAVGIQPGDEVITTPFSFVASANCILYEQGIPVFVDIHPYTWNIEPGQIEHAITRRTKAILPVHVFGRPCRMDQIKDIASRHGLAIIEDACEALGAEFQGRSAGSFGDAGVFAFYPNKQMTTGEGGMIVTASEPIARLCRSWRNQGRGENGNWLQHERLGYNYRLSDINCALGIAQMTRLPEIVRQRASIAAAYRVALNGIDGIVLPRIEEPRALISWFVYVIRLRDDYGREQRDAVLAYLSRHGIGCSNYFFPIHLQPFYRQAFGFRPGDFPVTERISDRTVALPFFNRLSQHQIGYVAETLRRAVASVRRRLSVMTASDRAE